MSEARWFALYTRSRNEKKVLLELQKAGINAYLPLVSRLRQWSDRKKMVEEPLFRSYIFVHITETEYFTALNVTGAVRFITFSGKAVPIPDNQIIAIRNYLDDFEEVPEEGVILETGQLVKIKSGPMEGLIGKMIRYRNRHRLIIQIDAIGQNISLSVPRSKVEVV